MVTYAGMAELGAGEPWWAMVERAEWPQGLQVDLELICVLILRYICGLILLHMCPHTAECVASGATGGSRAHVCIYAYADVC
jgi:hypothetical protein